MSTAHSIWDFSELYFDKWNETRHTLLAQQKQSWDASFPYHGNWAKRAANKSCFHSHRESETKRRLYGRRKFAISAKCRCAIKIESIYTLNKRVIKDHKRGVARPDARAERVEMTGIWLFSFIMVIWRIQIFSTSARAARGCWGLSFIKHVLSVDIKPGANTAPPPRACSQGCGPNNGRERQWKCRLCSWLDLVPASSLRTPRQLNIL